MHSNNYQVDQDEIIFIHIPKTAGTSIHTSITDKRVKKKNTHLFLNPKEAPSKREYFTFFRQPVDRVWSYFHMDLRQRGFYSRHNKTNIKDFIETCWETNNTMLFIFSGKERGDYYHNIYHHGGCLSDTDLKELYNCSKTNLDDFKFIGFLENFEASINRLKQYIQIDNVEKKNSYNYRPPTEEEKNIIAEKNQWDQKLYDHFFNQSPYK